MDAWDYINKHKYDKAYKQFSRELQKSEDYLTYAGRFTASLCLGWLDRAEADIQRAQALATEECKKYKVRSSNYAEDIAMVQWLKGEKNRAVEGWVSVMEGIRKGEIEFADMAGGVQPGALVWFAGVYMKNDELVEKAKKYLAKLAGRSRIEYWPGPVAKHILGKMGEQDVLDEAITRDEDIVDFDRKGRPKPRPPIMKDPRVKRKLCQANFYIGISRLARGDREGYAESLRACTKIPMPIELEYFLARGELEKVGEKVKR